MGFAGPIMAQSNEEIEGRTSFCTFDNINEGFLFFTEIKVNGRRYTVRHHMSWKFLIDSGKYWQREFKSAGIKNEVVEALACAALPGVV